MTEKLMGCDVARIEKRIEDLQWQERVFHNIASKQTKAGDAYYSCVASRIDAHEELRHCRQALLEANLKPLQDDIKKARKGHGKTVTASQRLSDTVHAALVSNRGG